MCTVTYVAPCFCSERNCAAVMQVAPVVGEDKLAFQVLGRAGGKGADVMTTFFLRLLT